MTARASDGVHMLYGEIWATTDPEFDAEVARPREPRTPELMFEHAATLGIDVDTRVLDIGAHDGQYAIELVRRFGCRVVAADPVPLHLDLARTLLAGTEPPVAERVEITEAAIEHLPFDDGAFDLIWSRDMLNHVALRPGLAECRRVLRSGGAMLAFQTFATPLLEPNEARRLYEIHSIHAENMDPDHFVEVAEASGFVIETQDAVTSEWREHMAESGKVDIGNALMTVARMRRFERDLVSRFGRARYEATLADHHWGIYLLLGKLSSQITVLRVPNE